jgi:hypothetical protein
MQSFPKPTNPQSPPLRRAKDSPPLRMVISRLFRASLRTNRASRAPRLGPRSESENENNDEDDDDHSKQAATLEGGRERLRPNRTVRVTCGPRSARQSKSRTRTIARSDDQGGRGSARTGSFRCALPYREPPRKSIERPRYTPTSAWSRRLLLGQQRHCHLFRVLRFSSVRCLSPAYLRRVALSLREFSHR